VLVVAGWLRASQAHLYARFLRVVLPTIVALGASSLHLSSLVVRFPAKEPVMRARVLEKTNEIRLRDIEIAEMMGSRDVRIAVRNVGICGSEMITDVFPFEEGVQASDFATRMPPTSVKAQIEL
jgi:hypothetical protein